MAHSTKTDGKRVLTRELYGLRGNFGSGWSYEHLPAGTEFELSRNEKGKDVLLARGRTFLISFRQRYEALHNSKPV